jgi:hypothetical protein
MRMQLGIALVIAQGAAQDFVVPMFCECLEIMCTDTCSYLQIDCMAPFDSMAVRWVTLPMPSVEVCGLSARMHRSSPL